MKLKDIAAQLGVSDTQIRKWKNLDQWELKLKGNVAIPKRNVTNTKDTPVNDDKPIEIEIDENNGLTEKQRLFCIYYVKNFNATQAAIKAGYAAESAHVEGSRLLRNAKVAAEIRRIKQQMTSGLFVEAMDVLQEYIKIAFADITDFVTFGKKEITIGKDKDGNPITKTVNYVDFKDSNMIDGTIVTEVKQGKDGVSIKIADKMKALEKLSLYFDLFPDNFKRKIEEEKLKIAHYKAFGSDEHEEYEDDGFLEALDGKAEEVWGDED